MCTLVRDTVDYIIWIFYMIGFHINRIKEHYRSKRFPRAKECCNCLEILIITPNHANNGKYYVCYRELKSNKKIYYCTKCLKMLLNWRKIRYQKIFWMDQETNTTPVHIEEMANDTNDLLKPNLLQQSDLNYLVEDLELSTSKADLLGYRLKQWNLMDNCITTSATYEMHTSETLEIGRRLSV